MKLYIVVVFLRISATTYVKNHYKKVVQWAGLKFRNSYY